MITENHISSIYKPRRWSKSIYDFESIKPQHGNYTALNSYNNRVEIQMIDMTKEHYYFQLNVIESIYKGNNAQKLLRKINMAFDCITAKVSRKGTVVGVSNVESLQKNWETHKNTLKKEYQGTAVSKLLKSIDTTLKTEQKLTKSLAHPKLYGLFFNGYWQLDESSLDLDNNPIIKTTENNTVIEVLQSNTLRDYKGFYLYNNNRFVEATITQNNIKYNLLCLG